MTARLDLGSFRARYLIPAVAGNIVKLHRAGNDWKACCPFHVDRSPSFTIYDGGQRFRCFGCGAAGDVLDFVQRTHRVGLREAAAILDGGTLPIVAVAQSPAIAANDDRTGEALAIWEGAENASGTPAESYLRSRRLSLPLPPSIRFKRLPYGKSGPSHPVLVALVTDPNDNPIGIQRTYLNAAGTGKAAVAKPKLSLGKMSGGAIRLARASETIVVCEGLEDGLSVQQALGVSTWATAGTGGLTALQLPPCVQNVVIAADNDDAGNSAAKAAAVRFASEGRSSRIIRPLEPFKDFNDELRGVSR